MRRAIVTAVVAGLLCAGPANAEIGRCVEHGPFSSAGECLQAKKQEMKKHQTTPCEIGNGAWYFNSF